MPRIPIDCTFAQTCNPPGIVASARASVGTLSPGADSYALAQIRKRSGFLRPGRAPTAALPSFLLLDTVREPGQIPVVLAHGDVERPSGPKSESLECPLRDEELREGRTSDAVELELIV